MVTTRRLTELISATLPKLEIPDVQKAMVALSGGADSGTLAFLALEAGLEVGAIHIDHQLPASTGLSDAARAIATALGITIDVRSVTVAEGPSPEDQARRVRYEALSDVSAPVLTGHTRDDSVETVLLHLIRGSGPTGLTGIPRFRSPNLHRPLLEVTRNETREIAALAGLPFVDDPMNLDASLTRNQVRLEILPLMRELNPRVDDAIARAAAIIERDTEYLDRVTPVSSDDNAVPISVIATLPRPLADRVLGSCLEGAGVAVTADRIERMWSVVGADSDREDLAGGLAVLRRGALLVVE